ncbi:MAG: ABC transporter ATP-binding protein [Dehalococcoidales bacterium]|nr:ABC transporter ATP-binding protein [Dehalococcoidales bacterium]
MLLEVKNITVHYKKALALSDVSINVDEGEVVTIIGSNGAGKSTTLRAIDGIVQATSGEIWFRGERIDKVPAQEMVRMGIAHCMEGRRLFPEMTVLENLEAGTFHRRDNEGIKHDLDAILNQFPILGKRRKQNAGTLSGGEQQMLAIARALMARPKLLLLDEPSIGLAPMVVQQVGEIVKELNEKGISVLIVEQNAEMALGVAHRGYLLEVGRVTNEGTSKFLRDNDFVRKSYLGV